MFQVGNRIRKARRMKTKEQIEKEIKALEAVRPNVRPYSMFGDNHLAALDAQLEVLEDNLDEDDIFDKFDYAGGSGYELEAALQARR